jgi:hypothetical protein
VTIARHFNAGFNPPKYSKSRRDYRGLPDEMPGYGGNNVTIVLPSLPGRVAFGLWPNPVEPQARGYNDVFPFDFLGFKA